MRSVLVDAGPLIALQDRSDREHRRVRKFLATYEGALLTTWPVLAEVCHFLPERTQVQFLRWAAKGGLHVVELPETALAVIADWKEKYRNVPMDLADASLVWVAEETAITQILTIDLRGCAVYRLSGNRALTPVL